eukprot:scaffold13441_cov290-Alexandrium_tamarense.AAC.1
MLEYDTTIVAYSNYCRVEDRPQQLRCEDGINLFHPMELCKTSNGQVAPLNDPLRFTSLSDVTFHR